MYRLVTDVELHSDILYKRNNSPMVRSIVSTPRETGQYQSLETYGGWEKFLQEVPLDHDKSVVFDEEITPVMATDSSTFSMTILAALEFAMPDLLEKEELLLHIVGATVREHSRGAIFEDLLHLLPGLKRLKVIFGGLELPVRVGAGNTNNVPICASCTTRGRTYTFSEFTSTYHDYVQTSAYRQPDLAVLFHTGRRLLSVGFGGGLLQGTWAPTTRHLVDSGTLTLCTSFTAHEAARDAEELDSLPAKFLLRPEMNKWRGLVPIPVQLNAHEHSFCFINQFWYIFKGGEKK
ncbi:unnamed protein product [Zymoseptoria tritici ST99CH_3D1]|nr:unnamed protein product [Zymoseptoria tritici ST99CH_3D1]